jgi:hypothetical protein
LLNRTKLVSTSEKRVIWSHKLTGTGLDFVIQKKKESFKKDPPTQKELAIQLLQRKKTPEIKNLLWYRG